MCQDVSFQPAEGDRLAVQSAWPGNRGGLGLSVGVVGGVGGLCCSGECSGPV